MTKTHNDTLTIAAIAILAMCLVVVDHETIGHGGACLALGGRITLLTTSLFQCDTASIWASPAGPAMNLLMGGVALLLSRAAPRGPWKLFLILITAFSWFWEGGYLMQAMLMQKGDLHELAHYYLGDLTPLQRAVIALPGLALFALTTRLTARALGDLFGETAATRAAARTSWLAATAAIGLASFAGQHGFENIRDSLLEIGGASIPLLFMRMTAPEDACALPAIPRSFAIITAAVIVFAGFTFTQGHGYAA